MKEISQQDGGASAARGKEGENRVIFYRQAISHPEVMSHFLGVEENMYAPYLIHVKDGEGLSVLDVGYRVAAEGTNTYYTGTSDAYFSVLPRNCRLDVLPTNQYVIDHSDFIDEALRGVREVRLLGGEDPIVTKRHTSSAADAEMAKEFGGFNEMRDIIEDWVLSRILSRPEIFPYLTCRGMELLLIHLTGVPPGDVPRHHWPAKGSKDFVYHPVRCILPSGIDVELPEEMQVSSYHHLGYSFKVLRPYLSQLTQAGWLPAYIDATEGVPDEDRAIEMMLRFQGATLTGIASQWHIERQANKDGEICREWVDEVLEAWCS